MTNVINLSDKISRTRPLQLDLFSKEPGANPALRFFDLSQNDHESFLSFISTHSIKAILDTRESIAFPKYQFQHKALFQYFDDYQISYENISSIFRSLKSPSTPIWLMEHGNEFKHYLQDNLKKGSCIVLYDSSVKNSSVELYRKLVASHFELSDSSSNVM